MYNKLFTKILDSSIWLEPTTTRIVWITFIAVMDETGFVAFAAPGNVAKRAGVELHEAEAALKALESPDPNSSDPDNDGRRIERVQGGWMVLNSGKYRAITTRIIEKEQTRQRVARFRAKQKAVTECNAQVTQANDSVTTSEAEAEADTERSIPKGSISVASLHTASKWRKPTLEEVKFGCSKAGLPDSEANRFWDYYESNGWRVGKNPMRSWSSALANWKRNFDTQRYANSQTNRRSNPRNDGIAIGPTDYGEAAKRKLERQALEARNREASEAQGA